MSRMEEGLKVGASPSRGEVERKHGRSGGGQKEDGDREEKGLFHVTSGRREE